MQDKEADSVWQRHIAPDRKQQKQDMPAPAHLLCYRIWYHKTALYANFTVERDALPTAKFRQKNA
jgi:hypothetical protein